MDIPLQPGVLLDPYTCFQPVYEQMFALGKGVAPDITGILIQDAAPDPIYRGNKGWIPTSGGVPIYPGYVFIWHAVVGHWVSRNPIADADSSRRIWVGNSADIDTYDGGEAGVVGAASGPMWALDTLFDGRVPIGAGNIPGTAPAISVAVNATQDSDGKSGEYKHVLTGLEGAVGDHVHPVGWGNVATGDLGLAYTTPDVTTPSYTTFFNSSAGPSGVNITVANLISLKANNGNGVISDAHNTMQPYYGVYFIKRTARQFYRIG